MKKIVLLAFAILGTAAGVGFASLRRTVNVEAAPGRAEVAPVVTEWDMTETERFVLASTAVSLAKAGIVFTPRGPMVDQNGEIARVTSGDAASVAVANMVLEARGAGRAELAVEVDASKRLGVAVVRSGSKWVRR